MEAAEKSKSRSDRSDKSKTKSKSKTRNRSKTTKGKTPKTRRTRGTRGRRKARTVVAPKLQYMELPKDYAHIDPSFWENVLLFWSPIFKRNELMELRERIHAMIAEDEKIQLVDKEVHEVWSVCKIVKKFFPSYFIPMKNKSFIGARGYGRHKDVDFSNYQILCCTTMMLYGIICDRLIQYDQDYQLVFKGGKAIQMGLTAEYVSEDIDILVDPIQGYDPVMMNNLSGHLSLLIKWLLPLPTSVLPPGTNPHIYKVSFITSDGSLRPFSDIDFKRVEEPFFNEIYVNHYYVEALQEQATFKRPTIEKILEEKVFYYSKYKKILEQLDQGIEIEGMTKRSCLFFMDKFKRAIQAISPDIDFERL